MGDRVRIRSLGELAECVSLHSDQKQLEGTKGFLWDTCLCHSLSTGGV